MLVKEFWDLWAQMRAEFQGAKLSSILLIRIIFLNFSRLPDWESLYIYVDLGFEESFIESCSRLTIFFHLLINQSPVLIIPSAPLRYPR